MQAGAEVIAVQVGDLEVEQAEGVCAIDDHLGAVCVRHVGDLLDRHQLANPVDHVGDVDQLRARSHGLLVGLHDRVDVFDGKVEADLLVDDAVALGPLAVRVHHVGIVLLGADDLVARLQRDAVDDGV